MKPLELSNLSGTETRFSGTHGVGKGHSRGNEVGLQVSQGGKRSVGRKEDFVGRKEDFVAKAGGVVHKLADLKPKNNGRAQG